MLLGCDSQWRQNGETDCLPLYAGMPLRTEKKEERCLSCATFYPHGAYFFSGLILNLTATLRSASPNDQPF